MFVMEHEFCETTVSLEQEFWMNSEIGP